MEFWLGPPGDLRALPPIEHDQAVDAPAAATVGEFVSLSGAVTRDQYGRHRRAWALPWVYLTPDEADEIDALRAGHLGWPLWLIDPQRPNLAPRQVASTGTELASTAGWSVDVGTLSWSRLPLEQRPRGVSATGVLTWTLEEGQAGTLSPARSNRAHRVPVNPRGGHVSAAAHLRVSPGAVTGGGSAAAVAVDTWAGDGTRATTAGQGGALGAAWLDLADAVRPTVGAQVFALAVVGSGPITVQVAGARYGHGQVPPPASVGGGAAIVLPGELTDNYPSQGEVSTTLNLVEA